MKNGMPAWLRLAVIALAAGLLLGFTNELTAPVIKAQAEADAPRVQKIALPAGDTFEALEVPADAGVDACYAGKAGDVLVGYVAQATAKGYGGEVEVLLGMDLNGVITGINVGGANFAETSGLGSKVKEPAFMGQFAGKSGQLTVGGNIDAVTAATISSTAVVNAANAAYAYMQTLPMQ